MENILPHGDSRPSQMNFWHGNMGFDQSGALQDVNRRVIDGRVEQSHIPNQNDYHICDSRLFYGLFYIVHESEYISELRILGHVNHGM